MGRKQTKKLLKKLKTSAVAVKHSGKRLTVGTKRDGKFIKFPAKKRKRLDQAKVEPKGAANEKPKLEEEEEEKTKETGAMSIDQFLAGGFNDFATNDEDDADIDIADQLSDDDQGDQEQGVASEDDSMSEADEEAAHQADLDKLKETDPEFYAHLASTDAGLLKFSNVTEDSEQTETTTITTETPTPVTSSILTTKLLNSLEKKAFTKNSMKGVRDLIQAFKSGCYMSDALSTEGPKLRYTLVSPLVFQKLVLSIVRKLHGHLAQQLDLKRMKSGALPSSLKGFSRYERLIKSFLKSYIHLLSISTDASMLQFLLQSARHYGIYLACYPESVGKVYLKVLLTLWGTTDDSVVRILAFLRIRQIALEAKGDMLERCLRGSYLTFVRNAKFAGSELEAEKVAVQAKCFVELCQVDMAVSYQCGFTYIRQVSGIERSAK